MMRLIYSFLAGTFCFLAAAQEIKLLRSEIKAVTVFQRGAKSTRVTETNLSKGFYQLVLTELPSGLDANSIQIRGKGNVTMLGIKFQRNYLSQSNQPKLLIQIQDSIDILEYQLKVVLNQHKALTKEYDLLLNNKSMGGKDQTLTANQLEAMADFYGQRIESIGKKQIDQDQKKKELQNEINRLKSQLSEKSKYYRDHTGEILVDVEASTYTKLELEVDYLIHNAGWIPLYDARLDDNKLQLSHKANVYQTSGEDWNQVKLQISNGNPNLRGTKPQLYSWALDVEENPISITGSLGSSRKVKMEASFDAAPEEDSFGGFEDDEWGGEEVDKLNSIESSTSFVTTTESFSNVVYTVDKPYTIPSDGKSVTISIAQIPLTTNLSYSTVPKLDQDAFIIANTTGWENLNLLEGEMKVYVDGNYVSTSRLYPSQTSDTIEISLGRDKGVIVERKRLWDYTSQKTFGSKKKETFGFEIKIRNTKEDRIDLIVEDQIPVSRNKDINVVPKELSHGRLEEKTGTVKWKLNIQPNETKTLTLKFDVVCPSDKVIIGL